MRVVGVMVTERFLKLITSLSQPGQTDELQVQYEILSECRKQKRKYVPYWPLSAMYTGVCTYHIHIQHPLLTANTDRTLAMPMTGSETAHLCQHRIRGEPGDAGMSIQSVGRLLEGSLVPRKHSIQQPAHENISLLRSF